jgi:enamine deaminase RidA (YjgF/YER057c/UK114 family)
MPGGEVTSGPVGARIRSGGPYEDLVGYARAVVLPADAGARVIVSGSTSAVDGAVLHPGDAYRQTITAFDVIERALAEAGGGPEHVVRTRMFVVGREHCDAVGRAHGERMALARPAATMVLVAGLIDEEMLVEVEAEAVLPAGVALPAAAPGEAGQ